MQWLFIFLLGFGYVKFEGKVCHPIYGSHRTTLQNAIEACDQDNECKFVQDNDCDDDYFRLCKKHATLYYSSRGSCIYQKRGKSVRLPISIIVT